METNNARIQFLSDTRNRALEPLVQFGGYDRVVFSNDVFFEAESVVELLETKGGDYDMACGLDLSVWGCVRYTPFPLIWLIYPYDSACMTHGFSVTAWAASSRRFGLTSWRIKACVP